MEEIIEFYIFEIILKLARITIKVTNLTLKFDIKAYVEVVTELKKTQEELETKNLNFSEKEKLAETAKLLKKALVRTAEQVKIPQNIMRGEETY